MILPLLGLALGRRPPVSLVPLLVAASAWCRPRALDPVAGDPAAILARTETAGGLPSATRLALWAERPEELESAAGRRAAAVVSDDPSTVEAAGSRGVYAAAERQARGRLFLSPFVRDRLRQARGLPALALLEQTAGGWRWAESRDPLERELVATAMAAAAAVAVTDRDALLEALAWGAPSVSDSETAAAVRAVEGRDVLVADEPERRRKLASHLAADAERAAGLSWAGRKLVERWHDADAAAIRLVDLLGLRPLPRESPAEAAALELGLLGTPRESRIAARLREAAAFDR